MSGVSDGRLEVMAKEGKVKRISRFEGIVEVIAAVAADFGVGKSDGPGE